MSAPLRAVTFDATGTLFHAPRLGEIYSEVLGRHGLAVSPPEARRLVREVWQELSIAHPLGGDRFAAHSDGARGWWRRFVERLADRIRFAGSSLPSAPFAAAELYSRFGSASAWEIYAEVPATLARLRERGLTLGVVSNWDDRLPHLLRELGLAPWFETIVHSAAVGREKPDAAIFQAALDRLAVAAPETLHVGDGVHEDFEGADAAGLHALLLVRGPRRRAERTIGDLSEVLSWI